MPATPERIRRKAEQLRTACIKDGVVFSPSPELPFADLPKWRQERWLRLAAAYCEIFDH